MIIEYTPGGFLNTDNITVVRAVVTSDYGMTYNFTLQINDFQITLDAIGQVSGIDEEAKQEVIAKSYILEGYCQIIKDAMLGEFEEQSLDCQTAFNMASEYATKKIDEVTCKKS